jgi:hypothetical protein
VRKKTKTRMMRTMLKTMVSNDSKCLGNGAVAVNSAPISALCLVENV